MLVFCVPARKHSPHHQPRYGAEGSKKLTYCPNRENLSPVSCLPPDWNRNLFRQ